MLPSQLTLIQHWIAATRRRIRIMKDSSKALENQATILPDLALLRLVLGVQARKLTACRIAVTAALRRHCRLCPVRRVFESTVRILRHIVGYRSCGMHIIVVALYGVATACWVSLASCPQTYLCVIVVSSSSTFLNDSRLLYTWHNVAHQSERSITKMSDINHNHSYFSEV